MQRRKLNKLVKFGRVKIDEKMVGNAVIYRIEKYLGKKWMEYGRLEIDNSYVIHSCYNNKRLICN